MGCFLGCFGKSKARKRRKQRNKVIPRDQQALHLQRHGVQYHLQIQNVVSAEEEGIKESPAVNLVPELSDKPEEQSMVNSQCSDKPEEQSSSNTKKKVTFDANVTTYEHVSVFESVDSLSEYKEASHQEKEDTGVSSSDSRLTSEDDSVNSSVGSYPPNHRYQNCRDSDDEDVECGDGELEDDDYDEEENFSDYDDEAQDRTVGREIWSESVLTESMESRTNDLNNRPNQEGQVDSMSKMPFMPNQEVMKPVGPKGYARNRSDYVHPVLNPVQNLTQWKTMKSKGTLQMKVQKENVIADFEAPFSSEPTLKQSSSRSKPKLEQKKSASELIAVDASLSTWLSVPESTPARTTSIGSLESVTYDKVVSSTSQGSNSVRRFEDRPILGALTVEEIRQMSAASSPRKSPSRSPDEMPIIGTVGTYWNDSISSKESRSASSYKGIPNTTNKYREDKRVNWHSTPFETRLERALNRRTAGEV